ncbi:type VI secretion system tube protein Hcp [Pseudomonas sp. DTU_2021_1001937_2_SI_NGA_ILE_001]|uniref:Hcp family type VI secretion system effector n=1 Tax=Pseudomonas sp. DTU_2021_1001937_2_SI_NGA_ILE_001 TaxID=3077589 RepID=UPI0028FC2D46|nr:type VI secretion system tube protein Hcp [Pseudomonas sp. DTU_2021_1001937_2_SI_NGA_ILE_001]WNW13136.1 type VI secretion system tube protein Hcp [Pseudomonas sp. DTU_2021_1001937_2_SI_NGA_ILE_001]
MTMDMFLKLGNIKGESRDSQHRDEIDIQSFQWGMTQNGSMHQGSGGGASKVSIQNLSITKALDKSTPNLLMACSSGMHFPEATLTVRKAGGNQPLEYLVIRLKEVLVASFNTQAVNHSEVQAETFALNFASVEVSYQPQKDDGGKAGGALKYGWNIRENRKL